MSTFSVDGLVSGLDTTSLIRQLMQVESIPKQQLQVRVNETSARITAYQSVASVLKKLDDAVADLALPGTWSAVTATSSGAAATAVARAGAAPTTVDLVVDRLATAARWTTDSAYGLDEPVFGTGPITITAADGTSVDVTPAGGTMRDTIAAVNGATGSTGVTAVAVRVGDDSYRLQLVSTATGTAAAPQAVTGLAVPVTATAALDAQYVVNGIPGTSGSNTVTDLVSGVDVTLVAEGTATVTVAADPEVAATAVKDLVAAANEALKDIAKATSTDPDLDRGPLASDSLVRALTGRVQQALTDLVGTTTAASFGLQTTRDGTLELDEDALSAALADDPLAVQALFAPPGGGGIVDRVRAVVDAATDPVTGFITSAVQGRESTKRDLESQILSWDRRLETRQAMLQRQFAGLEVALGQLRSQSSYLAGQLGSLSAGAAS